MPRVWGLGLALGFLLGLAAPSFGVFVSFGPLLMIRLCLVPCLAPLLLLRKPDRQAGTALPATSVADPIAEASYPRQAIRLPTIVPDRFTGHLVYLS